MPLQCSQQRSGRFSNQTREDITQRLSAPFLVRGIDISSLDARNMPNFATLSISDLEPDANMSRERERTNSFFGNIAASRSMGKLPEPKQETGMSKTGIDEGETSSYATTRKILAASPYIRPAPGSSPELGISVRQGNRSTPDILKAVRPDAAKPAQPTDSQTITNSTAAITTTIPNSPSNEPISRGKYSLHRTTKSEGELLSGLSPSDSKAAAIDPPNVKPKASRRRLPHVLSRTKSTRADGHKMSNTAVPSTPTHTANHSISVAQSNGTPGHPNVHSNVAPFEKERSMKQALKASTRARSEDRAPSDNDKSSRAKKEKRPDKEKERDRDQHPLAQGYKKNNGSGFFGDFKSSSSKAADGIGKAGKGFFSRLTRSSSSNDKVGMGPEEEYEPRILKLPLIQQTRETRIAKSYDHCRDKTEFWMPALPWRCIDYLNGKCEEEGLYRVSGGLTNVRRWRKRFDIERDVNLLDEKDLYDASVIASLFKEWIRELPEEIFPKPLQAKIAATLPAEVPGSKPVPQSLRDELSNLPPFNYYLLFAITCHLSLLLSHQAKNKMTLDNLYRCFNQSLKLDGRIFYTLVGDWRQCWQGCYTEDEYLRAEYDHLKAPMPIQRNDYDRRGMQPSPTAATVSADERAVTSSSGSAASATGRSTPEQQRPATSHTQPSHSASESDTDALPSGNKPQRSSSDVTGASPMKVRNSVNPN